MPPLSPARPDRRPTAAGFRRLRLRVLHVVTLRNIEQRFQLAGPAQWRKEQAAGAFALAIGSARCDARGQYLAGREFEARSP
jgi:hypothetical protein